MIRVALIILFIGVCQAKAQENIKDTAMYKITYKLKHMRDTTRKDVFYEENVVVYIGKNYEVFKSAGLEQYENEKKLQMQNFTQNNPSLNFNRLKNVTLSEYYKRKGTNIFWRKESLVNNNYIFKDTLPVIKWKILNEEKRIQNLNCQKAIGYCRGRFYTVWFCKDIPSQSGPWKLNGLPGLILEATDSKNEIQFNFLQFEQIKGNEVKVVITIPAKCSLVTKKEWNNLIDAYTNDPMGFTNTNLNAQGIKVTVSGLDNSVPKKRKAINNPIELKND